MAAGVLCAASCPTQHTIVSSLADKCGQPTAVAQRLSTRRAMSPTLAAHPVAACPRASRRVPQSAGQRIRLAASRRLGGPASASLTWRAHAGRLRCRYSLCVRGPAGPSRDVALPASRVSSAAGWPLCRVSSPRGFSSPGRASARGRGAYAGHQFCRRAEMRGHSPPLTVAPMAGRSGSPIGCGATLRRPTTALTAAAVVAPRPPVAVPH